MARRDLTGRESPDELARHYLGYALHVARRASRRTPWLADEAESVALVALARAIRENRAGSPLTPNYVSAWVWRSVRTELRRERLAGPIEREPAERTRHHPPPGPDYAALVAPLTPKQRATADLLFVDGHNEVTAAAALGVSRTAVQSSRLLIRKRLSASRAVRQLV